MRKVECAELVAADLFRIADRTRARITYGAVERHLAQLATHPRDCGCGRCWMVQRVTPHGSMTRKGGCPTADVLNRPAASTGHAKQVYQTGTPAETYIGLPS